MKRREMIKAASALVAAPLFYPWLITETGNPSITGTGSGSINRFGDGRDWFFEKRYGMFVHWGLYSIPAWHEQHQ